MTPKKDEYMRGYGEGFKDGSVVSIRDWFAGQALAGLATTMFGDELVIKRAFTLADAMLSERSKAKGAE